MLVVELAIVVEADDGTEELEVVFADEQRAGSLEELTQRGGAGKRLSVVVHIGEGGEAIDAEEREGTEAFLVDVETARNKAAEVEAREFEQDLVVG